MRDEGRDELDQILDSALASYSAPQSRPGLEQRVIVRVFRAKQRDAWLRWLVATPALAGVLMIIGYWREPQPARVNAPQRVVQSTPAERDAQLEREEVVVKAARVRRAPTVQPSLQKAAVFPMPSPVTSEERALMQLAASNPEVLQNMQIARQQWDQPLTLEPIRIPPLERSGSMEN